MLCAAGKVDTVIYGFVTLDFIPLHPHFRAAREDGRIQAVELDEGMLQLGRRAAACGCRSSPAAPAWVRPSST